jgi:hypothetical protein
MPGPFATLMLDQIAPCADRLFSPLLEGTALDAILSVDRRSQQHDALRYDKSVDGALRAIPSLSVTGRLG